MPILGVLNQPITGERWAGVRGGLATYSVIASDQRERGNPAGAEEDGLPRRFTPRNDDEIFTRPCASLSAASISTTSTTYFTPAQADAYRALATRCRTVIEGGDCYAYGLLARGERDIVLDAGLKPYDILALVPIIEAAGGVITAWDGQPITLTHYATALAARMPELHKEALEFLYKSL